MKSQLSFILFLLFIDIIISNEIQLPKIKEKYDDKYYWGSYNPQLYHSLKTREAKPITTGLIWSTPNIDGLYTRFLYDTKEDASDGVGGYDWLRNDGLNYGEQEIIDTNGNLRLRVSFIKSSQDKKEWTVRVSGSTLNASRTAPMTSFLYFLKDENVNDNGLTMEKGTDNDVYIQGNHKDLGDYSLLIQDQNENKVPLSSNFLKEQPSIQDYRYSGFQSQDTMNIPLEMLDKDHIESYYGQWDHELGKTFIPTLSNKIQKNSNTIVIQKVFSSPFNIEISFIKEKKYETLKTKVDNINGKEFESQWEAYNLEFETKFQSVYPMNKFISNDYKKFGKILLSNILGSFSFNNGLFSTRLNRSKYSRFWEEGLSQIVVKHWNDDLTIQVLTSWLNSMKEDGSIASEDGRDGGPPTIFITIGKLLDRMERNPTFTSSSLIKEFIKEAYPRLEKYFGYFRSQTSESSPLSFRWRGRNDSSALQDYPRSSPPSDNDIHLDLASWVAYSAGKMARIGQFIERDEKEIDQYKQLKKAIFDRILLIHWHQDTDLFYDAVYQPSTKTYQLIKVNGYLNYVPLALGLIDLESPILKDHASTLKGIQSVWSRFGIRSVALNDPHYQNGVVSRPLSGPISIAFNYLFINSIGSTYMQRGPQRHSFYELYYSLRYNIVENVYTCYRDTGFTYQQYHPIEGTGQGVHPYQTPLVLLLMSEQF